MSWVRTEAFLSIIAMAMAFMSGALVLSVKDGPPASISAPALETEIQNFLKNTEPLSSFSTDDIHEFINPANKLPFYFEFDLAEVQALQKYSENCRTPKINKSKILQKAWQWQSFKCGQSQLPGSFFATRPFFHPSGKSYAFLHGDIANLKQYHVLELKELGIKPLPAPYDFLTQLEWQQLFDLSAGNDLILSENFVLAAKNGESIYQVFKKSAWNTFWKKTPFQPQMQMSGSCSIKQSGLCWSYDLKLAYFPKWNPLVILLVLAILLTGLMFWLLAARITKRMQDERRLQFALEMLAHEIRTPLSNLAFITENFRSHFDAFPPQSQGDLLKLFDQVERLKRVTDSSSRYLSKDIKAPLLEAKFTEITSLTAFIEHTLDPFMSQVELKVHDDSRPLLTDPYWVSICIKNITENAIKHGKKPVTVTVTRALGHWSVVVEDQGTEEFNPKQKGESSHGLGLGLKLIQEIVPLLNGTLAISYNPTKMTLTFKENP